MLSLLLAPLLASQVNAQAGIVATGKNGPTNPDKPEFLPVGAQVNQTSMSRLLTVNSVDDFCLYAPPEPGPDSTIGNTEGEVVAWCTKPRNNARLIPDGVIKSAQLLRTPAYIQISGTWDGTKLNIPNGDDGGELDPHGPTGEGNPVGGNVTTNMVGGKDVFYEEWMSFISYQQFCVRICTAEVNNIPAALMCEHELDLMGCNFVMAIPNDADTKGFTECDGEPAAPPGLYPQSDGSYSTFRQRFTGSWGGAIHTIGNTVTPSAPAFFPKSSNCKTFSTIANGVDTKDFVVKAAPTLLGGGGSSGANGTSIVASVGTTSVNPTPVTTMAPGTSATPGASSGKGSDTPAPKPSDKATDKAKDDKASASMTPLEPSATDAAGDNSKADGDKPNNVAAAAAAETSDSGADTVRQLSIYGTFAALAAAVFAMV